MIILNKRNFNILFISILVIFSFVIFLNISLIKDIEKDYKKLNSQKQELYLFQKQIQEFESFKDETGFYKSDFKKIEQLFVNKETPIDFIQFLEKQSQELGILIKISPITIMPKENDLWENLGFRINLTGSFPKCLAFLEKVQLSKWLSDIEKLEISRISERDISIHKLEDFFEGDVFFSINLKVYVKEENK
jgi:hypothetical protein